jgi:hypothetical protein
MFRTTRCLTLLAAICLVLGLAATASAAADANGTWTWKFTTQGGQEFELSLMLKAEGEKLTGAISLPNGQSNEIMNGEFKNDEVSFITVRERNGQTFTTKFKGKVDGDTIKGKTERERDGQTMILDWEAKRQK